MTYTPPLGNVANTQLEVYVPPSAGAANIDLTGSLSPSWSRYAMKIDHTKVSGGVDLVDFPVLIKDSNIPDSIYALLTTTGRDIRFTTDFSGLVEVPFEIVAIDTTAKTCSIWVKLPLVTYATDTVFYLWYGNASALAYAATDTYGAQNVWNSTHVSVHHLQNNSNDSTVNALHGTDTNTDPLYGHWKLNSSPADASDKAYTLTEVGITYGAGKITNAAIFDGATSYLKRTSAILSNKSVQSVAAWIYLDDLTSAHTISSYNGAGVFNVQVTTGKLQIELLKRTLEGTGNSLRVFSVGTVAAGAWYHVAAVYNNDIANNDSRSVDEIDFYINGVKQSKTSQNIGLSDATSTDFYIGAVNTTPTNPFKGKICDFRRYNKTLLQADIDFIYNAGAGTESEISASAYTAAKIGIGRNSDGPKTISLGNPALLQFTYLTDFTFSIWCYQTVRPGKAAMSIYSRSAYNYGFQSEGINSPPDTSFRFGVRLGGSPISKNSTALSLNTWYKLVGVYNATARTIELYINGVSIGTVSTATSDFTHENGTMVIGGKGGYSGNQSTFQGLLDEVRNYNVAQGAGIILTQYNNESSPSTFVVAATITIDYDTNSEVRGGLLLDDDRGSELPAKQLLDDDRLSEIRGGETVDDDRESEIFGKRFIPINRNYRILVKDGDGNFIGEFDKFKDLNFGKRLNNYGECSFSVLVNDQKTADLIHTRLYTVWIYQQENATTTLLWAGEQARKRGSGDNKGAGWVTIYCYTWLEMFNSRFTVAEQAYENIDAGLIVADLINRTQLQYEQHDTGTVLPGTVSDDASIGTISWTSINEVKTDDATPASAEPTPGDNITHYIKATNFGFAIPSDANILGIQVDIKEDNEGDGVARYVTASTIKLVKGGTIQTNNIGNSQKLHGSPAGVTTYGDQFELFGDDTLTYADINASNFGVAISLTGVTGDDFSLPIGVYYVKMTIYYETPATLTTGDFGITIGTIEPTTERTVTYFNQNIMQAIIGLANILSGIDFEITDDKVLNVYSLMGEDKTDSVVLEYGNNVDSYDVDEDFSHPANRAIVLGEAIGEDSLQRIERNDTDSQTLYKIREQTESVTDPSEITTLEDIGDAVNRKYGVALMKIDVNLVKGAPVSIVDFGLGDLVTVKIFHGVYAILEDYRVFEWSIEYLSDNSDKLSVVLGKFTI